MIFSNKTERDFWMKLILNDQKSQTNNQRSVVQMIAKADDLIYALRKRDLNLDE